MIKHVDQYPVSIIFPDGGEKIYKIPKYQREYTWGQKNWDALFNDIIENDKGYFLGSYICVSDSAMTNSSELIDGQQRFTSLSLLLLAIYSKLTAYKNDMDEDERTDYMNLRNQLANKYTSKDAFGKKVYSYTSRLRLQVQNYNNDDYQYMLYECGIIDYVQKPAYLGIRRIYKAFKHFSTCIDDYIADKISDDKTSTELELLFNLADTINSAVMVGIEVDTHKDAYMLFESLNHRGVPLSAIDLIKNVLIAAAEVDKKTSESYDLWRTTLSNIGDDYSVQERFFRHYYNAFRKELNEPFMKDATKMFPLGYLATKTTLLEIYEKLIRSDYNGFIHNLHDASDIYSIIVNNSDVTKSYSDELRDLERISGAPSYLLLLFLMANQDVLQLSDVELQTAIKLLLIFFVRRSVTDVPNTRKLTALFMNIIDVIRDKKGTEVINIIKKMLMEVSAGDELFERKLRGPIYQDNPDAARFILCSIEAQHQTKEIYTGLWERNKSGVYVWTIEHIFPEGDNIPDSWVQMIADGDKSKSETYRQQYVHTLGNLTITGYNSNLSNMSFEKKKERKSKDGQHDIGYRNGLFLNNNIVTETTWTIEKISKRTDYLVDTVLKLFTWDRIK